MARDILSDPEKAALVAAVKDVERRSSAEVVIAFRGCSGTYLDADLIAGILLALFTLWFQLFSPWEFSLPVILASPVLAGALGRIPLLPRPERETPPHLPHLPARAGPRRPRSRRSTT